MTGRPQPHEAAEAGAACILAAGPLTDTDRDAVAAFRDWLATRNTQGDQPSPSRAPAGGRQGQEPT